MNFFQLVFATWQDAKAEQRQRKLDDIGKCVIAYSFSDESGNDREGCKIVAKDYKINLVTYFDIFELICVKDKLTPEDIKNIIFERDINSLELSKKITPYIIKYG